MKIRGDGRLGGISEVLGNRKWKASRTWSSKWVTTGHGKVDKVKLVTNKGPGSEGHWSGQEVRWRGDLSQGPNCSVNLGPVCMWRNEPEAKRCEDKDIGKKRIPSWSHGWDSALSLLRASVPSLVGKLRFYKPHGVAKTQTNKQNSEMITKNESDGEVGRVN